MTRSFVCEADSEVMLEDPFSKDLLLARSLFAAKEMSVIVVKFVVSAGDEVGIDGVTVVSGVSDVCRNG